jgi:hypothetical protein
VSLWRPDVVVRESQEFAGCPAAERHGAPHARVALGVASSEQETLSLAAAPLDVLGDELGPAPELARRARGAMCLTVVPPAPERASDGACGTTRRFRLPRDATGRLPDWCGSRAGPLVDVTLGSVAGSRLLPRAVSRRVRASPTW